MLKSGRYLYVLFCCQQGVEKTLKACVIEKTNEFPARTHDLVRLAQEAGISLHEDQDRFLRTLTKFYLGTRYPEEVSALAKDATREMAASIYEEAKGLLEWLGK
jgi:HEPN domain-containing protein